MEIYQETFNTVTEMLNAEKPEPSNQRKLQVMIIETLPTQTQRNKYKQKKKNECWDYEENYVWKENHITFSQEPRLENSQGGTEK